MGMFKREKIFLTVIMFFAAVSLGRVTLSFQTRLYNALFAAMPLIFVGSVTVIFSSKKKSDSQAASDRKKNIHSTAGMYDFPSNVGWDSLANMNTEIRPPIDEIIGEDEIPLDTDTAIPCASVLIVAPTEVDLELIKDLLRPREMRIDCVDNGLSAVELITADDLKYDAVIIDYPMPVMDGLETVNLIREIATDYARSVPIIAVSSDGRICKDAFMGKEFQAFLTKPVDAAELDDVINRLVREVGSLAPC